MAGAERLPLVLVTGAGGFIGRHLIPALADRGHDVRALSSSLVAESCERVEFRTATRERADVGWGEATAGVGSVIHLAGRAHVIREESDEPLSLFRQANVDATVALARAAVRSGVRRFVFVSSIGVNGTSTREFAFSERSVPAPTEPYAVSKWEAEQALREIMCGSGTELVIVRLPLVHGPGVKGNFLRLMRLIETGLPLPLGSLNNRRSYAGVANVCDFLIHCLGHPAAAGELFLLADDEDISTPDLIRALAEAMMKPARLYRCPLPVLKRVAALAGRRAELERLAGSLQVDTGFARGRLGWVAPQTSRTGIWAMGEWYRELRS